MNSLNPSCNKNSPEKDMNRRYFKYTFKGESDLRLKICKFLDRCQFLTHRIHVWYIYLYICHENQPNIGVYIAYMDPMGKDLLGLVVTKQNFPDAILGLRPSILLELGGGLDSAGEGGPKNQL